MARASSSATRTSLAARSKTPRGRPNPLREVPDGGGVQLAAALQVVEQDRSELDQPQGRFAPGDDGVHAGTVAVVRADAAVAVAVERGGIAARAAIALAGNQIDKRRFLGLLHISLSLSGAKSGWARDVGAWPSATLTNAGAGFCGSIRGDVQPAKRENRGVPRDRAPGWLWARSGQEIEGERPDLVAGRPDLVDEVVLDGARRGRGPVGVDALVAGDPEAP